MASFFFYLFTALFGLVSFMLIMLILIQKGRGGGLSGAFGGAGGQTAFGSKTGDVLTWATSIIFGLFVVLSIALGLLATNLSKNVVVTKRPAAGTAAPVLPPTSGPSGASATSAPATAPAAAQGLNPALGQPPAVIPGDATPSPIPPTAPPVVVPPATAPVAVPSTQP